MNNKKRTSLKTLILLPVFILGALTIICNVMAINNIRTVNSNAADITDNCMMSVSDLGEIKNDIQVIHTLGLSHIIATDLNTMISIVGEINDNQEELEKKLDEYKKYVQNDDMDTYVPHFCIYYIYVYTSNPISVYLAFMYIHLILCIRGRIIRCLINSYLFHLVSPAAHFIIKIFRHILCCWSESKLYYPEILIL